MSDDAQIVSINNVGHAYLHGKGTDKNIELATKFFITGMQRGSAKSFYNMGVIRRDGLDGYTNPLFALELFEKAEALGGDFDDAYENLRRKVKQWHIDAGVYDSVGEYLSSVEVDAFKILIQRHEEELKSSSQDDGTFRTTSHLVTFGVMSMNKLTFEQKYRIENPANILKSPEKILELKKEIFSCGLYHGPIDGFLENDLKRNLHYSKQWQEYFSYDDFEKSIRASSAFRLSDNISRFCVEYANYHQ